MAYQEVITIRVYEVNGKYELRVASKFRIEQTKSIIIGLVREMTSDFDDKSPTR